MPALLPENGGQVTPSETQFSASNTATNTGYDQHLPKQAAPTFLKQHCYQRQSYQRCYRQPPLNHIHNSQPCFQPSYPPTPTPLSTKIKHIAPPPAQAQQNTPLPASVLPELFPQTALHNKGRLTPGLGGSHPGASKLTKTKHRRHRFCPHQRYPNKSHPHKRKSTPNTATSISYTGAASTSRPTATSNDTQTITPSQAHFPPTTLPPTTLPPASVRPALFTAQCHCYQQHHLNKPHPHKSFFHKQHCH